jgi:hypothetical protein
MNTSLPHSLVLILQPPELFAAPRLALAKTPHPGGFIVSGFNRIGF